MLLLNVEKLILNILPGNSNHLNRARYVEAMNLGSKHFFQKYLYLVTTHRNRNC